MSNSNEPLDQELEEELNKGLKYSDGILNIVDEMARHAIIKNKNVDELNLLFTLQDFYNNNEEAKNGNKRRNLNSLTKKEPEFINECSRKELPKQKKKKKKKFESFSKLRVSPVKRVNSVKKNKFAKQFNKEPSKQNNNSRPNKNSMQKKYVNINKSRLSVLINTDNFIIDEDAVRFVEDFGYKKEYIIKSLELNELNHASATYYLKLSLKNS